MLCCPIPLFEGEGGGPREIRSEARERLGAPEDRDESKIPPQT
jgi:hypothetical protein